MLVQTRSRIKQEEEQIRNWLDGLNLPQSVVEYRIFLDNDSTGDPAVFPYFVLADNLSDAEFLAEAQTIHNQIWASFADSGMERFPYSHFRTRSEQAELDQRGKGGRW